MSSNYKLWINLPYAGEDKPPSNPEEPLGGSWPTYYINHANGIFTDLYGNEIKLDIKDPNHIDWDKELAEVHDTLSNMTSKKIKIAKYWGTGVPTKQWTPIIDRLIDTYGIKPGVAARILAAIHAGINDTLVVTWFLKYRWLVARPNQLDHNLETILCTPRHPTYPAGHGTVAGCAEVILSYFFPTEAKRLHELAKECAESRLYACVHFPPDNNEGLKLGRQIGQIVVDTLKKQTYMGMDPIDKPSTEHLNANLPPAPYKQVIDFTFNSKCQSKVQECVKCTRSKNQK